MPSKHFCKVVFVVLKRSSILVADELVAEVAPALGDRMSELEIDPRLIMLEWYALQWILC